MDLIQLVGSAVEDSDGEYIGQILGFKYYNGRIVITVAAYEYEYEDDPDPGDKEPIPEDIKQNVLNLVGGKSG
ncbi:MAG: hypothetical protein ACXABY_04770 [Candidatus Thorarchaeota archaeon]|jgi:hypothetical protein